MQDLSEGGRGGSPLEADPMTEDEFIAFFCPHCGACVNEDELENDHGYEAGDIGLPSRGSLVTCGWCKMQTTDWNHIVRCRNAQKMEKLREFNQRHLRHDARAKDLAVLLAELG